MYGDNIIRNIHIALDEGEYTKLMQHKGELTWKELLFKGVIKNE